MAVAALLLPSALAEDGNGAATPAIAAPAAKVQLAFTVPARGAADINVAEQVSCSIVEDASGQATPCGGDGTLADARVMPGAETYSFLVTAPTRVGNYTARFTRSALVSVPGGEVSATARFTVAPGGGSSSGGNGGDNGGGRGGGPGNEGTPLQSSGSPTTPPTPPGGAGGSGAGPGADAARWLVSTFAATAAVVGSVVVGRRGGR